MIHDLIPNLAATDSDTIKIVIGVVLFVAFQIFTVISNAVKKAEAENRRRLAQAQSSPQSPTPTPSKARRAMPGVNVPKPQVRTVSLRKPMTIIMPGSPMSKTRAARTVAAVAPVIEASQLVKPLAIQTIARPPTSATAASIRNWMRPATMRQQFILTEVLQPPLALRDNPI